MRPGRKRSSSLNWRAVEAPASFMRPFLPTASCWQPPGAAIKPKFGTLEPASPFMRSRAIAARFSAFHSSMKLAGSSPLHWTDQSGCGASRPASYCRLCPDMWPQVLTFRTTASDCFRWGMVRSGCGDLPTLQPPSCSVLPYRFKRKQYACRKTVRASCSGPLMSRAFTSSRRLHRRLRARSSWRRWTLPTGALRSQTRASAPRVVRQPSKATTTPSQGDRSGSATTARDCWRRTRRPTEIWK